MECACWRHAVFVLLRLGLVGLFVVVGRLPTGGRPATTYLFCFAKIGMPKKATQSRCPCGMPNCAGRKMGKVRNSPAAQTRTFLIHFPPRTIGSATCEFESKATSKAESKPRSKPRSKARSKANSKAKSKAKSKTADCRSSMCLSIACVWRREPHHGCVDLRLPHVALPLVRGRKWIRKVRV
jgi:hypothetical protein